MRRSSIFVLALSLLTASALPAMADSINFVGSDGYTSTDVYFTPGQTLTIGAGTGIFSPFTTNQNYGQAIIGLGSSFVPSNILVLGQNGNLLSFYATSESDSMVDGFLLVTLDGTIVLNGTDYNGVFSLSTQGPANNASYSATLSTVPEPTSVALLGTGLLGFAGMVRRKFMA